MVNGPLHPPVPETAFAPVELRDVPTMVQIKEMLWAVSNETASEKKMVNVCFTLLCAVLGCRSARYNLPHSFCSGILQNQGTLL